MKYTCPCCGYITLDEEPPGTYEICNICFWEDDLVQFNDPDYEGGANIPSLRQAQRNYLKFGACDELSINSVREPLIDEIKDFNWKILSQIK
ncbi:MULTISPECIES: CPCC family cysteine-rich protein [Bacillaceae]|uniref:CPCC family cysteine-rich protein n=1 Tax=Bacillaceae TaxID=186817 RepID=UPI002A1441F1|nr:CPCC family cysteine-rich protein [Cytobacillus sp. IB215316]MDX8363466.1 CPCC family cysteine-rich protein [Cytobacillus sp. IB215316]